MKVGELIAALSKLDPDLPVVMWQQDEPPGDYEVSRIDTKMMRRSSMSDRTWTIWDDAYKAGSGDRVAYLYPDRRYPPPVDAEVVQVALPSVVEGTQP